MSKHQIQPGCGEWADWRGTRRPNLSHESRLSGADEDSEKPFPSSTDYEQDWQPYPVDTLLKELTIHDIKNAIPQNLKIATYCLYTCLCYAQPQKIPTIAEVAAVLIFPTMPRQKASPVYCGIIALPLRALAVIKTRTPRPWNWCWSSFGSAGLCNLAILIHFGISPDNPCGVFVVQLLIVANATT